MCRSHRSGLQQKVGQIDLVSHKKLAPDGRTREDRGYRLGVGDGRQHPQWKVLGSIGWDVVFSPIRYDWNDELGRGRRCNRA